MATYKIRGTRYLRKYTAATRTPVYAAASEAQRVVDSFCDVPWEKSLETSAQMAYHTNDKVEGELTGYDMNVKVREKLDAALFCAEHVAGLHRAYANAACYVFKLPDLGQGQSYPSLTSLKVRVTSDPYNAAGARIAVHTNSTGEIPMSCTVARTGAVHAEGVAPRTVRTENNSTFWYPTVEDCTLTPDGGLQLQQYLLVVVALESYSTVRGNWLEGCSYIEPVVEITTAAAIPGWTDGATEDAVTAQSFAVALGGVYQSTVGAVSEVLGIEVTHSGDNLDDLPKRAATAASDNVKTVAKYGGYVVDVGGSTGAPVTFVNQIVDLKTGSNSPDWRQYVIVLSLPSDGFKGIRLINPSSLAITPIPISAMTDDDYAAGLWNAWIEGGQNSDYVKFHIFTRNKYEIQCWARYYNSEWMIGSSSRQSFASDLRPAGSLNGKTIWTVLGYDGSLGGLGYVEKVFLEEPNENRNNEYCKYWRDLNTHFFFGLNFRFMTVPVSGTHTGKTVIVISGSNINKDNSTLPDYKRKNVSIITIQPDGTISEGRPSWDESITPDTYDDFCVSPIHPMLLSSAGAVSDDREGWYIVTGGFTKLGGVPMNGCALVKPDGTVVPLDDSLEAPNGLRMRWFSHMLAIDGGRYFYRGFDTAEMMVYPREALLRAANATAAQSCIGLRAAYAHLYTGQAKSLTKEGKGVLKHGAGFVVTSDTRNVLGYDAEHESDQIAVPVFRLSLSSVAVPFSAPITFPAKKVKVDWEDWAGTATGGKLHVWLKRGEYVKELSETTLKKADLYTGGADSVDGWEFVGDVDATLPSGSRSKTFELAAPLTERVATLMFTAFVDCDSVNPDALTVFPQGVATEFEADAATDAATGLDKLLAPDITLLG